MLVERRKLWRAYADDGRAARDHDWKLGQQSDGLIPLMKLDLPDGADGTQAVSKIRAAVADLLTTHDPSACLGPDSPQKRSGRACDEYVKKTCGSVSLRGGTLFRIAVSDDYELEENRIATVEEFSQEDEWWRTSSLVAELDYRFCTWAALAGAQADQSRIKIPDEPDWIAGRLDALTKKKPADRMLALCGEEAQPSIADLYRLALLEQRLPKGSYPRGRVSRWREMGVRGRRACQSHFARLCKNVTFYQDTPVVSYVTIRCRVRDVTSTDVESDTEAFFTEAQRLGHLQLKELLQFCQSANEQGYSWAHVLPSLKGCRPSRPR